jgi:DNA-binding LacI/PurR family transcriptional regulator
MKRSLGKKSERAVHTIRRTSMDKSLGVIDAEADNADASGAIVPLSSRTPTISDVAEIAGVSRSTVSRAFSRPKLLSEATVQNVRVVAAKLGYFPNEVARALSTGRYANIAIVVPDIANPFFPPLIRAVQAGADAAGFSVFLGDSDESAEREEVLVQRLSVQVDGFILGASRMSDERIRELSTRRPLVLINRDTEGMPRVLIDTVAGIDAAVSHLAGLGHKSLVYVSGPAASWSDQQRRRALRRSVARYKVKVQAIPASRPTFEAGRSLAAAVFATDATAAITFDDLVAHGLLAGLMELAVEVPKEFSVIGCDDVLGASTYPALTSVSARCDEAGRMAVELLLSMLRTGKTSEVRCVLDTRLAVRATTANVFQRKASPRRMAG